MTWSIAFKWVALAALLLFSAFFSSAEVALFSLNPIDLRRLGQRYPRAAKRISHLLSPPTRFLSTILIGNTLVNVLIAVLGFALALRIVGRHGEWVAILVMTLLLLIFGEVLPKRVAFLWPERMAVLYASPLSWTMHLLTPLRVGLEYLTRLLEHAFRPRGRTLSDEEFETVIELSGEMGVLRAGERDMMKSILRLEDLQARDIMTPRVDLIAFDLNGDRTSIEDMAKGAHVRQLVLYRDTIDRVEGLLDVRRFLLDPMRRVQAACLLPQFVPESARLDRLLDHFLRGRARAAVVVDEYGGTAGIVTRGDILEEIVGDIDDEHADHRHLFEPAGPDRWVLDGQISLEEINQKLDIPLVAEGVDRLAGWIAAHMERMPRPGDRVEAQGARATVQQMRRHRITLVLLERTLEGVKDQR